MQLLEIQFTFGRKKGDYWISGRTVIAAKGKVEWFQREKKGREFLVVHHFVFVFF